MRRLVFASLLALFTTLAFQNGTAQTFSHKWAIGTGVDLIDYQAPLDGNFFTPENFDPGLNVSVGRYLSGAFALSTNFTLAQGVRFPGFDWNNQRPRLLDMNYLLHFKLNNGALMKESARIAPYFVLGFGGSHVEGHPDLYVPMGGGIQFRMSPKINLRTQVVVKRSINKDYQNVSNVIAFVYNLGSENPNGKPLPRQDTLGEEVFAVVPPQDTDEDGIVDIQDECPDVAGVVTHEGCPDASSLALALMEQMPPTELYAAAGPEQPKEIKLSDANKSSSDLTYIRKNIPAKSNQTIAQAKKRPVSQGRASFLDVVESPHGPAPTTDQAEVAYEAKNIASSEINKTESSRDDDNKLKTSTLASRSILFDLGSDRLNTETKAMLDEMASMLHNHDNAQLLVKGHTDAVGTDRNNLVLSIMRAYNVKYYLVYEHGISQNRIRSSGFGERSPIASNDTNQGRQQNRRVDFELVR